MAPQVTLEPMDSFNQTLVNNVHPSDRPNPKASGRYNLVVIGAGTAGIVTAAGAAGLGAKVALVEKHLIGGDCLNVGCVPSKCIIRSSRAAADVGEAKQFGVRVPEGTDVDFAAVMERMRKLRSGISVHDSAEYLAQQGVDVFLGAAHFTGQGTLEVEGQTLTFKRAVIATGARAVGLPVEGLSQAGYLTNETLFSLTERPRRLAVIGGGPIGSEMAQAFNRLGSEVTVFEMAPHILSREDADAAQIVQTAFLEEGVRLVVGCKLKRVQKQADEKVIHFHQGGHSETVVVDTILVGAGRAPNVDNLGLENAGVKFDKRKGVQVNDFLQTTNPKIYAAGDICMAHKFTHAADAAARIVIENALFFGRKRLSALTMPWCTYTDPEIAHVGLYEKDAQDRGIEVTTFVQKFSEVDRAIADGEENGLLKIHVKKGTDQILGATLVARHAGEMISEISVAMAAKMGLGQLSKVIHPYPTQAEAIRKLGDAYNATLLTPLVSGLLKRWLTWTR